MSVAATIKALVADNLAKIRAGEGVESRRTNSIIRYWEHVPAGQVEACVGYLRAYTSAKNGDTASLSVSGLVVDKTTLSGSWRGGKVSVTRDGADGGGKTTGNYTIYQELHEGFVTTTKSGASVVFTEWITESGSLRESGSTRTVLRLPNVDPSKAEDIRQELQANESFTDLACRYETISGKNYYIESVPRHEDDGSYSVLLVLLKMPSPISYLTVGGRKTDFVTETQRIYEDIPAAYVTELVTLLVATEDFALVDCDARKTSTSGVFDVYLTLRTMILPPGGNDVLVGTTGGIFKTEVRVRRNILDIDLEVTIVGLSQLELIDNVRATGGRDSGFWDVMYSVLILPPARTEYKKSEDRKEYSRSETTLYDEVTAYRKLLTDVTGGIETETYHPYVAQLPQAFFSGGRNKTRTISITSIISYSVTQPSAPTFGELTQLANGIWQKIDQDVSYPWWSDV